MKLNFQKLFLMGVMLMFFTSCSQMPTFESFNDKKPMINIKDYFNGDMEAWGILQSRSGEVKRRFTVKMIGSWVGDVGTLKEYFEFDNGEKQERIWTLTLDGKNTFKGKAADVIGIAEGQQHGNGINMKYTLRVPVDTTTYDIKINDWLILLDERRLINISELTKFGFNVGRLTIFFEKK